MVELRYIVVGSLYYWYVTGFHLMYSDNGIAWKYYKELGDEVCILVLSFFQLNRNTLLLFYKKVVHKEAGLKLAYLQ